MMGDVKIESACPTSLVQRVLRFLTFSFFFFLLLICPEISSEGSDDKKGGFSNSDWSEGFLQRIFGLR